MPATSITFNGYSFQSAEVVTPDIDRYSMPTRIVQTMDITRSNRQKVVASFLKQKTITIAGNFLESTEAALQAKISEARANLMTLEGVLQIPFNGLTLQYQATVTSFEFPRANYNKSFCPYTVQFTCVNPPHGVDASADSDSMNVTVSGGIQAVTNASNSFTMGGEIGSEPTITVTVNSETSMIVFQFTNDDTGESITVTPSGGFTAGDILIMAARSKSCLLNGSAQDYTGIFPEFSVGVNNYTVYITSISHDVDVDITWQDYYL